MLVFVIKKGRENTDNGKGREWGSKMRRFQSGRERKREEERMMKKKEGKIGLICGSFLLINDECHHHHFEFALFMLSSLSLPPLLAFSLSLS